MRDCALPLARDGARWVCERGHGFDIARSGYVSLLQPQDRRSLDAGDTRETVDARRALLDAGYGDALREALIEAARAALAEHPDARCALELGCGDGHFLAAIADTLGLTGIGIDLSAHAVERCARRHPRHVWIAANADRRLPLLDASIDLALSIDGRRPASELARVLSAGRSAIVAVPADDDLLELRESIQGSASGSARAEAVQRELGRDFDVVSRSRAHARVHLDRSGLAQLALATYRFARARERERLDDLDGLTVTTSHDVLRLVRRGS